MKTLVLYDSTYGNTEKIAQAIAGATGAELVALSNLNPAHLPEYNLLIIGSPTHSGGPTKELGKLLRSRLPLKEVAVAAFDTRVEKSFFGFAAGKIAKFLEKNGARLIAPPEGFIVQGTEGPLKEGEIERATEWGKKLTTLVTSAAK